MALYDRAFYERQQAGSRRSAEVVVPLVLELLGPVASVIDVGCGVGTWLACFRAHGVAAIYGVDGDHVERSLLQIPQSAFHPWDLAKPFATRRQFDLALSLEVAEHLPESRAAGFVRDLCRLAPVVLFSAAIPGQPGTGHINLQWPDYWAKLFAGQGFQVIDAIRPAVWQNPEVRFWYAQNTLLFANAAALAANAALARQAERSDPRRLAQVHPRFYLRLVEALRQK